MRGEEREDVEEKRERGREGRKKEQEAEPQNGSVSRMTGVRTVVSVAVGERRAWVAWGVHPALTSGAPRWVVGRVCGVSVEESVSVRVVVLFALFKNPACY